MAAHDEQPHAIDLAIPEKIPIKLEHSKTLVPILYGSRALEAKVPGDPP